jgi:hypothetical protein
MQCAGCRDYRIQVELQRRHLAAVLPVSCSFALKDAIAAQLSTGPVAGFGTASGGFLASGALKGLALKPLLGATMAALGLAGAVGHGPAPAHGHRAARATPAIATTFRPASARGVVPEIHQSAARHTTETTAPVIVRTKPSGRQHHAAPAIKNRAARTRVPKPAPASSEPAATGPPSDNSSPAPTTSTAAPSPTTTSTDASQSAVPPPDAGSAAPSPELQTDEQGASHQHATGRGHLSGETEPVPFSS